MQPARFFSEVFATVNTTPALNGKALGKNKTEIRKDKSTRPSDIMRSIGCYDETLLHVGRSQLKINWWRIYTLLL